MTTRERAEEAFSRARYRAWQLVERARQEGVAAAARRALWRREEAIPVEKDLATLPDGAPAPAPGLALLELGPDEHAAAQLRYVLPSRAARAASFLRRGYRTFVLVRGRDVVADVWYVTRETARTPGIHPHARWFGLDLGPGEVYMFDMHVVPQERGGGLATRFMGDVLRALRDRGHRRAFGYYAAGNTAALWVHRLLGFRERPRVVVRWVLSFEAGVTRA